MYEFHLHCRHFYCCHVGTHSWYHNKSQRLQFWWTKLNRAGCCCSFWKRNFLCNDSLQPIIRCNPRGPRNCTELALGLTYDVDRENETCLFPVYTYIYINLYFLICIYIIYIYFNRRKFALVEGLGHDLVCAGSIYHVHFAWQVWHGQYSPSFRWKGFAGRRLNKHNFEASVFIYIIIYMLTPPKNPPHLSHTDMYTCIVLKL